MVAMVRMWRSLLLTQDITVSEPEMFLLLYNSLYDSCCDSLYMTACMCVRSDIVLSWRRAVIGRVNLLLIIGFHYKNRKYLVMMVCSRENNITFLWPAAGQNHFSWEILNIFLNSGRQFIVAFPSPERRSPCSQDFPYKIWQGTRISIKI